MMKKILLLFFCLLFALQCSAADITITDDFEVEVNKDALLAALYEADIPSLRKALDLRLITCEELTRYYLERIEAYDKTFNCFITLCDNAIDIAKERDEAMLRGLDEGSLFGIPIVVKDNVMYEGYPTTNGVAYLRPNPSTQNAAIVQYLLDEGAIILGKTNMSAAAQDAICSTNASGLQTFNAYNENLASGGSSGGSAVAVSLNFAAAGIGTDTNASLRYPAALNGCITLRPTLGRIERDGCIILNYSRDTAGAITRSVLDQAIMLDVMTLGKYNFEENLNAEVLKGIRLGVLSELSYPIEGSYNREENDLDNEIQAAFDNAVKELESCGAEIITVSMPTVLNDFYVNSDNNSRLYSKLEKMLDDNGLDAVIYPTYLHTPHYTTPEYLNGKSIYDLPYICNCAGFSPLTGAPEIGIPIGRHSLGAGISMEVLARKEDDQMLLDIAYSYMLQYDHREPSPIAPSLYNSELPIDLHAFLMMYEQAVISAEQMEIASTQPPETIPVTLPPIIEETELVQPQSEPEPKKASAISIGYYIIPCACILAGVAYVFYRRKKNSRLISDF
ncbi:MAG: amidase [Ruminococcaceae bacterium]|nr:amidase [Oscillospiraceae bacterium]